MDLYRKTLLSFSDVADGVDGVIWKAGLQSSTADASGIGINGVANGSSGSANIIFTDGGISTSNTNNGNVSKVEIAIPAGNQAALRGGGRLQFDVKASDAVSVVTQNNAKLSFRDATNAEQGARVIINGSASIVSNQATGYINTFNYCVLALDPTWSPNVNETENSQSVCFDDSEEWVTLTVSWYGGFVYWLINGQTVTKSRHAAFTANPTYIRVELVATTLADRIPIRNMILCDNPAPDSHDYVSRNIPSVVCMGHSFWITGGGYGVWEYDSNERMGSTHHLASNIHKTYLENYGNLAFKNISHDGSVSDAATVITGHAESVTLPQLTWDWTDVEVIPNRILSKQADFALLMVHGSDTSISVVDTQLQIIINTLITNKTIPIVIREQNRDAGGQDRTTVDAQVVSTVGVYTTANGNNWVGIVDLWTPTGGSTVNPSYVETIGILIHPSLDVGSLYGSLVSAEINRLANNPPSYSRWANR